MTESWTIYIRVRGETLSSLRKTYEDLDSDGRDSINRTGRATVVSTNWFESAEYDEIGIDITVEIPDKFNNMPDREKEEMIYELFTGAYVEPWLGWFWDDLDEEDWCISVRYNGSCNTYEDGYYDGSPKENVHEELVDEYIDEDTIYITKKDISHIHINKLVSPDKDSKDDIWFDVDDDSIEVNDIVYGHNKYGEELIYIYISGKCTKKEKDVSIVDCTFKCSLEMYANEDGFSEAYRENSDCVEFYDGEITIRNKEINLVEKWELSYFDTHTIIYVYFNKG